MSGQLRLPGEAKMLSNIHLKHGDCSASISEFGAQCLSWKTSNGHEQLYLSPRAAMDGQAAIRGGVPLCFPQFNMRVLSSAALPKHGLARLLTWRVAQQEESFVRFELASNEAIRAQWPHEFLAGLEVSLGHDDIRFQFDVLNTGQMAFPFAIALHTYFSVNDVREAVLSGLQGCQFWDAVQDTQHPSARRREDAPLRFGMETDRVYIHATRELMLSEGNRKLRITQSESMPDTVVWNPGESLCARIADMPTDGWRSMLCVEAAAIEQAVVLQPGQRWLGWQRAALMDSL
jgi:glucose-6-phosphate 1-epimerase